MSNYTKPVVLVNENMAEGVYAASGAGDCYEVTTSMTQIPQQGRISYVIQVNATHDASHHSGEQVLTLTFNQTVELESCASGNGYASGNQVFVTYNYHNNPSENIGLGSVYVVAQEGLQIVSAELSCNKNCGQH